MSESDAGVIKRVCVETNQDCGINLIQSIPANEPAIVALGGDLTHSAKQANYYASTLKRLLAHHGLSNVGVYSVYYCFAGQDAKLTRKDIFRRAGHRFLGTPISQKDERKIEKMRSAEPTPKYVESLFNIILRPRIFKDNGEPHISGDVMANVRKLKFLTHCHGAAVIQMLGDVMRREMLAAGFGKADIRKIQSQILVVQYAPLAPLEKSAFTTVSFASVDDTMMNDHNNALTDYVTEMSAGMRPAFFAKPLGNIFVAPELRQEFDSEHALTDLMGVEIPNQGSLTANGIIIYSAIRNAIIRGAKHSLQDGALPDVRSLTNGENVDFDALHSFGQQFYEEMALPDIRAQQVLWHGKRQK